MGLLSKTWMNDSVHLLMAAVWSYFSEKFQNLKWNCAISKMHKSVNSTRNYQHLSRHWNWEKGSRFDSIAYMSPWGLRFAQELLHPHRVTWHAGNKNALAPPRHIRAPPGCPDRPATAHNLICIRSFRRRLQKLWSYSDARSHARFPTDNQSALLW